MRFVDVVRGLVCVFRVNYFCLCLFMRKKAAAAAASARISDASSHQIQNCVDFGVVTDLLL